MTKTLKGFISYLRRNPKKVQEAVNFLFPGEIVSDIEPITENNRSRAGAKSIILVTKINNDPKKQIFWKKAVKREGIYEIENNFDKMIQIHNHEAYKGILPSAVNFGKSDFFAMEYLPNSSMVSEIQRVDKSIFAIDVDKYMDPKEKANKKVELYNTRLIIIRDAISLDAKFITKGIGDLKDLPAEPRSLDLEKEMLANDMNCIIEHRKAVSAEERKKITDVLNSIGDRYNSAIELFADLLANGHNREYRGFRVHGDLGPHHILGNRMIDPDYRKDFEIADLVRLLKNPITNITDYKRVEAEINYFVLKRELYEKKLDDEARIQPEVMDVNNELKSPTDKPGSMDANRALRIEAGCNEVMFNKLKYLFYLKNVREDIRVLRHITSSTEETMKEYLGDEYVINEGPSLMQNLDRWYTNDIKNAFDMLLSKDGINDLMKNDEVALQAVSDLGTVIKSISSVVDNPQSK